MLVIFKKLLINQILRLENGIEKLSMNSVLHDFRIIQNREIVQMKTHQYNSNPKQNRAKKRKYVLNKMFCYSVGKIRSAYDMYDS